MPYTAFEVYDGLHPAARSHARAIKPLFARLSSGDPTLRRFDNEQDLMLVECEIRMSLDNVHPSVERQDDRPAVRIDRVPH